MIIRAEYADQAANAASPVNVFFSVDSMTVVSQADDRLLAFLAAGGTINAYTPPAASPTADQIDQATLNDALAQDGSVVRALAFVMLDEINALRTSAGLPPRTNAQLRAALKAKMR